MDNQPPTRADTFRYALAFALKNVRLARHSLGLSEEQRYEIADRTIAELTKYGGWPELNDRPELRPLASAQNPNDKRHIPK